MATQDEIQALRVAIAVDPGSDALRLHLADQLAKAGRAVEALAEYRRVLASRPDQPEALLGAETAAVALDDSEAAARYRALRDRPAPPAAPKPPSDDDAIQAIREAVSRGELAPALDRIRVLLVEAPHDERLLRWRGYIRLLAGEYDAALEEGIATAARTPSDGWGHWLQSSALLALDRKDAAIAAAREGLRREPSNERLLEQAARALLAAERYDAARALSLRLAQAAPDDAVSHRLLAAVAMRTKQWSEAEARLRRAHELEPDAGLARARANALWLGHRRAEAIEVLEGCVRDDPNDDATRQLLASYRKLRVRRRLLAVAMLALAAATVFNAAAAHPPVGVVAVVLGVVVSLAVLLGWLYARRRGLRA